MCMCIFWKTSGCPGSLSNMSEKHPCSKCLVENMNLRGTPWPTEGGPTRKEPPELLEYPWWSAFADCLCPASRSWPSKKTLVSSIADTKALLHDKLPWDNHPLEVLCWGASTHQQFGLPSPRRVSTRAPKCVTWEDDSVDLRRFFIYNEIYSEMRSNSCFPGSPHKKDRIMSIYVICLGEYSHSSGLAMDC